VHFLPAEGFIVSGRLQSVKTPIFPAATVVHAARNPPAAAQKLKKTNNHPRTWATFFIIDNTHAQFIITQHAKRSERYYRKNYGFR
jgi:hypothetical protein